MKYEVSIQNEHLVTESQGNGLALLDTGSPISLGADHFLIDGIRANTGLPLCALIGMDILGREGLVLDIPNNTLVTHDESVTLDIYAQENIKMRYVHGVPTVKTNLGWFAVDTGAMQTFFKTGLINDAAVVDTREEFLSTGETFVVDIIEHTITLREKRFKIRPAVMPTSHQEALDVWNIVGVIGLDILSKDKFVISDCGFMPVPHL
jgi:hypothetical protein